jgi:hypothetical protein
MTETVIAQRDFVATMRDPEDPDMRERNAIHTTSGAARFGFQGALVGGVTLYGWCIPTILEAFGERWLDEGWIHVMFRRPTYPDTRLSVSITREEDGTNRLLATNEDGEACLRGTLGLGDAPWLDEFQLSADRTPVPALEERPFLTMETAPVGQDLRTLAYTVTEEEARETAALAGDVDGLFGGDEPLVHPSVMARYMISLLQHSYDYGHPSIHASSHIQNLKRARAGQELVLTGHFVETYERGGHHYAVIDGDLFDSAGDEVARIRHTNIFKVAERG